MTSVARYGSIALCLALIGCGSEPSGPPSSAAPFVERFTAAKEIGDAAERDKTLAQLAKDAAAAGVAGTAMSSASEITDAKLRDSAFYDAGMALVKAGKNREAGPFAKRIQDPTLQQKLEQQARRR